MAHVEAVPTVKSAHVVVHSTPILDRQARLLGRSDLILKSKSDSLGRLIIRDIFC